MCTLQYVLCKFGFEGKSVNQVLGDMYMNCDELIGEEQIYCGSLHAYIHNTGYHSKWFL